MLVVSKPCRVKKDCGEQGEGTEVGGINSLPLVAAGISFSCHSEHLTVFCVVGGEKR